MSNINTILKTNVMTFGDELLRKFPNEPDLILLKLLFSQMPEQYLMSRFKEHVIPLKSKIINKDETFFLDDDGFISILPEEARDSNLRGLLRDLPPEEKNTLWKWFNVFLRLIEIA